MKLRSAIIGATILFTASTLRGQTPDEPFVNVRSSMVRLRSKVNSGVGVLLNDKGLILTNASTVAAPLAYECRVAVGPDAKGNGELYRSAKPTHFHREHDLALVRIDPSEHRFALRPCTLARSAAERGEQVFFVGGLADGGLFASAKKNVCKISGVDQKVLGRNLYQLAAQTGPLDQGGPLCNAAGEVLGIVTLATAAGDGHAIPLSRVKLEEFVPIDRLQPDKSRAAKLIENGNEFIETYNRRNDQGRRGSAGAARYAALGARALQESLARNTGNHTVYVSLANLARDKGHKNSAIELLWQSLQIAPWAENANTYRELGLQYAILGDRPTAEIVWREGVAKYPVLGSKIWEDLSILLRDKKDFQDCAFSAGVTLFLDRPDTRPTYAKAVIKLAASKLTPEQREQLTQQLDAIPMELGRRVSKAKKHWASKSAAITLDFQKLVMQQQRSLSGKAFLAREPSLPSGRPLPQDLAATMTSKKSDGGSNAKPNAASTTDASADYAKKHLVKFENNSWGFKSLTFTPDSRFLVAGKMDQSLQVYSLEDKQLASEQVKLSDLGQITAVRCTPDGKFVLAGGYSGRIQIYRIDDAGGLTNVGKFAGHSSEIRCIEIAADNATVLSGDKKGRLRCWDLQSQRERFAIADFKAEVYACHILNDREALACGRNRLFAFDLDTGKVTSQKDIGKYRSQARFTSDGRYLVSAFGSDVKVRECESARIVSEYKSDGVVWTIRSIPKSNEVVLGGHAKVVIFDFDASRVTATIPVSKHTYIQSIAVNKDGRRISAVGSSARQPLFVFAHGQ